VSNRRGVVYDANALVVLTPGQLTFNGTTYDVAAASTANNAAAVATAALAAATAAQATANAALPKAGGTMTGDISMGGTHKVTNLATPSANGDATNKQYVDNLVTGVLRFKGSTDCSGNPNYRAGVVGDAYVVSVAGKIGGAAGVTVEVGDVYFALANNAGGTQAAVGSSWDVLQYNLNGVLLAINNLSDLTNVATARTNLGLGTAATTNSSAYATAAQGTLASGSAQKSANLSDLASAATARTNLGLGTAATTASTDYATAAQGTLATGAAQKASNLSDLASAATARTNLGLGTAATTASTDYATAAQGTLASGAAQKSANLSDLATVSTARTNLGLGTAATTASSDYATAAQGALASTAAQRSGDTFSGLVNCSNQLMLTNTTPLRLGIGFTTGNFSNANAVIESLCNNKRFSFLASTANAALSLVDLQGGGKGAILFADTTGGAYIFDNAGTFDFTSDSQANIRAGTFGNGTSRLRVAGSSGNVGVGVTTPTAVMHLKAGTASANTAPIKLTSGTNLTTPEAGAMEYDGTSLYFTNSSSNRYNLTSPSPWTIDTAWTASNGSAQYFTVGQLAANGLIEVEVNLRAAVSSSALTSDFVMIKARAAFRRPSNTTLACQVLTATQDKQGSGQGVNVFLNIIEQGVGSGTIVVQVNGVASYTFAGQLFGWVK